MAELEDKLNQILSSPDAMEQIMSVARSLGIGNTPSTPPPSPKPDTPPAGQAQSTAANLLSLLGGSIGGGDPGSGPSPGAGLGAGAGMDPKMAGFLMRMVAAWNAPDDNKFALLEALRPFLKEERQAKIQRAMQISKISRVIRIALENFKGGDEDV